MRKFRFPHAGKWLIAIILIALFLLWRCSALLVDWLWFSQLGYQTVFYRLFLSKLVLGIVPGLIAFVFFALNLRLVFRKLTSVSEDRQKIEYLFGQKMVWPRKYLRWGEWSLAAFLAIPFALSCALTWDDFFRFGWGGDIGSLDPLYAKDIGFYLFRLPFWEVLQNSFTGLAFVAFALVLAFNFAVLYEQSGSRWVRHPQALINRQLVVLFVLFLIGYGCGFFLDRYELLYSAAGVVYGAGYTDQQIVRYGLWVMVGASSLLALILIGAFLARRVIVGIWAVGGYLVLMLAALTVVPLVIQNLMVVPNELELETPFLQREISMTRAAYGINELDELSYPALSDLKWTDIQENRQTLRNIRLWDWRPLLQTFRQLQEIRLYYQFYEVDADRYMLDGDYRQVMISARELAGELPERADTWVNRTLQFTHGYGLAMSLAAQEGEEGAPTFLVQDLPPVTKYDLEIDQAGIFYGEMMAGYRIVNTGVEEFDYPKGDENVYTRYQGKGGILLDSFWKKLLFAWEFGDINILLSSYLNDESRIQIRRQVQQRVARLAPFLRLDADPYLVLADKRLCWIQDAYTVSDRYPYSEPYGNQFNYIRNAVKVVVDAYDGSVAFYAVEPDDPILKVYQRLFPAMFRPLGQMSDELRRHLRYPEDLFRIQVEKFNRYHMRIPQVFYNSEDLWTLPSEKYAGNAIAMEPYYILMRLPGKERLEFLLMLPLTPQGRDNMIAWVAARSDQPDYGKLLVYKLPKEKLILGPMQVEAMIDQDPTISRQLSLWDQRGSKVIRGNLLVIPIGHSFIYVEPVFLIAEGNNIPQLRRVIVAYGDRVAMEPSIDQAIAFLFGQQIVRATDQPQSVVSPAGQDSLQEVRVNFEAAQQALQNGDWQEFGRAMERLQQYLEQQVP